MPNTDDHTSAAGGGGGAPASAADSSGGSGGKDQRKDMILVLKSASDFLEGEGEKNDEGHQPWKSGIHQRLRSSALGRVYDPDGAVRGNRLVHLRNEEDITVDAGRLHTTLASGSNALSNERSSGFDINGSLSVPEYGGASVSFSRESGVTSSDGLTSVKLRISFKSRVRLSFDVVEESEHLMPAYKSRPAPTEGDPNKVARGSLGALYIGSGWLVKELVMTAKVMESEVTNLDRTGFGAAIDALEALSIGGSYQSSSSHLEGGSSSRVTFSGRGGYAPSSPVFQFESFAKLQEKLEELSKDFALSTCSGEFCYDESDVLLYSRHPKIVSLYDKVCKLRVDLQKVAMEEGYWRDMASLLYGGFLNEVSQIFDRGFDEGSEIRITSSEEAWLNKWNDQLNKIRGGLEDDGVILVEEPFRLGVDKKHNMGIDALGFLQIEKSGEHHFSLERIPDSRSGSYWLADRSYGRGGERRYLTIRDSAGQSSRVLPQFVYVPPEHRSTCSFVSSGLAGQYYLAIDDRILGDHFTVFSRKYRNAERLVLFPTAMIGHREAETTYFEPISSRLSKKLQALTEFMHSKPGDPNPPGTYYVSVMLQQDAVITLLARVKFQLVGLVRVLQDFLDTGSSIVFQTLRLTTVEPGTGVDIASVDTEQMLGEAQEITDGGAAELRKGINLFVRNYSHPGLPPVDGSFRFPSRIARRGVNSFAKLTTKLGLFKAGVEEYWKRGGDNGVFYQLCYATSGLSNRELKLMDVKGSRFHHFGERKWLSVLCTHLRSSLNRFLEVDYIKQFQSGDAFGRWRHEKIIERFKALGKLVSGLEVLGQGSWAPSDWRDSQPNFFVNQGELAGRTIDCAKALYAELKNVSLDGVDVSLDSVDALQEVEDNNSKVSIGGGGGGGGGGSHGS